MHAVADWWLHFWEHTAYWDAFWPAVWGALVGAITAFVLERRYRKRERIAREVGECNKLIFILGQMLTALLVINDSLFEEPRKKLGRAPNWDEIGALDGAPTGAGVHHRRVHISTRRRRSDELGPLYAGKNLRGRAEFRAILGRVSERSRVWHEYNEIRVAAHYIASSAELPGIAKSTTLLTARIKELTAWLATPLPEAIETLKKIIPELRTALTKRYPKGHFIGLWPNDDPSAPPI
jgi:hypothetical protein